MDNDGAIPRFRRLFASPEGMGQLWPFAMDTRYGGKGPKNRYDEDLSDDKLLDF
jgi:hypothetical protein